MSIWGKDVFANAVASCLRSFGFDVAMLQMPSMNSRSFKPDDIVFFVDMASTRLLLQQAKDRGCFTIHYNMEPCEARPHYGKGFSGRFRQYLHKLIHSEFDVIFDYNGNTTEILRKWGVKAYLVPMGYHESYELEPSEPFERGVHWLGKEHHPPPKKGKDPRALDRRGHICRRIRMEGIRCFAHNFRASKGCRKPYRRLFSTSGIHLNLHRPPSPFQFGGIRVVNYLMSNKRFVLSEPCVWYPEGLTEGEHWDVAGEGELVKRVIYWLEHPTEREEVALAGYEFIKQHHRLDVFLRKALVEVGLLSG